MMSWSVYTLGPYMHTQISLDQYLWFFKVIIIQSKKRIAYCVFVFGGPIFVIVFDPIFVIVFVFAFETLKKCILICIW